MATGYNNYLNGLLCSICEHIGVEPIDVRMKNRKAPLPDVRRIFCYMAVNNKHYNYTLEKIGETINTSHDQVIKTKRKAEDLLLYDKNFKTLFTEVETKINVQEFKNIPQL